MINMMKADLYRMSKSKGTPKVHGYFEMPVKKTVSPAFHQRVIS